MSALFKFGSTDGHFRGCPNRNKVLYSLQVGRAPCHRCRFRLYGGAFLVTTFVAVLQFFSSMLTGSLSLRSDAWHMISDGLGYLISMFSERSLMKHQGDALRLAKRKKVFERSLALFIAASAVYILWEAGERLIMGDLPHIVQIGLLFWVAVAGLVTNVILLGLFSRFEIKHVHGEADSILRANLLHTLGDALSSLFVVANAVVLYFTSNPLWRYLDLGVAVFIAFLLLRQAAVMLWPSHTHFHHH